MPGKPRKRRAVPFANPQSSKKSGSQFALQARIVRLEKENRQLQRLLLKLTGKPYRVN
jgi:hypothetical protein